MFGIRTPTVTKSVLFVGPASVIVGNLVQGNRLASAAGRDIGGLEEETSECGGRRYNYISEILRWRNHATPDHVLFTLLNSKGAVAQSLTCSQLHKKAERIACLLIEKVHPKIRHQYPKICQQFIPYHVGESFCPLVHFKSCYLGCI